MIYLMIANIALAVSYALYHLFFRKLTFFQWNRYYLLGAVVFSFTIPIGVFIDLSAWRDTSPLWPTIDIAELVELPVLQNTVIVKKYSLAELLSTIYSSGIMLALALFIYRAIRLRGLFGQLSDYQSFSFFNRVRLGDKVEKEDMVRSHEQVHVSQGHSYDIVLLELVIVFNWFNPVAYLLRKELKFQHECIADAICSQDKVAYAELLVAHAFQVSPAALQHDFSNRSLLQKRIAMLFKNRSTARYKLAYLAIIPFLLLFVVSTLMFNTTKAREIVTNVENQISDVAVRVTTETVNQSVWAAEELADVKEDVWPRINVFAAQEDTTQRLGKTSSDSESQSHGDVSDRQLFEAVEIKPVPQGGMAAFRLWIAQNYEYPSSAIAASVKGILTVTYIVEADGTLSNIAVGQDLGHGTGEAAVRLLEKAEPWKPGVQNGRAVRVRYTLPIRIDLTGMDDHKVYRATPELGYGRLLEWLSAAFKLPRTLSSKDVDPYMYASFDVDEGGLLSNFKVSSDLEESFTNQFVSLLRNTKWNPEMENGVRKKSKGSWWVKFDKNGKFIQDYSRVELWPSPKKGIDDFLTFVQQQVQYPEAMLSKRQSGRASICFEVGQDGRLNNFNVLDETHSGLGLRLTDVIRKYGKWNPGIIDGRPIVTRYTLPVDWRIINDVGTVHVNGLSKAEKIKS